MKKFKKRQMFCIINPDETDLTIGEIYRLSKKDFAQLATEQRSIFSKKGFVDKFNIGDGDINSFQHVLRIIKMDAGY